MELFFGKYGATPTGIHLDTSDNLAFILRGPKRMLFWPRDRFPSRRQIPNSHAPEQELALTRDYEKYLDDAIALEAEAGDVIFWPKEYWHVGSSSEGWTAMITIPMWWNARPGTVARFILDRALAIDGEPERHPFNPDAIAEEALTVPATLGRPVCEAAFQVSANLEPAARLVWATLASSYGFTVAPAKAAVPDLSAQTRVRVRHPIVAIGNGHGTTILACGHRTQTSLPAIRDGLARVNASIGAEYGVEQLTDVLLGGSGDTSERDQCRRLLTELVSFRALETDTDRTGG
jgi:hypothetical protein